MQPDSYSLTPSDAEQSPKPSLENTAKLHETSSEAIAARAPERIIRLDLQVTRCAAHVSRKIDNTAPVAPPPRLFRQAQTPLQARRLNPGRGNARKTDLFRHSLALEPLNGDQRFQYGEKFREIKIYDDRARTLHNVTLHGDAIEAAMGNRFIQRESFMGSILAESPSSIPLESIAKDVEAEVMWRLNIFSPAMDYVQQDSDAISYLTRTMKTLCLFLWYCTPRTHCSKESVINSAAQLMQGMSADSTAKSPIETLAGAYMSKIIEGFADFLITSLQLGISDNPPNEYNLAIYEPFQLIIRSRKNGRLTKEYIEWVTEGHDDDDAQKQCIKKQSKPKLHKVEPYKYMEDTRQKFIMNPLRPGVVSLLLLKKTNPVIVRDVSTMELSSLGWFLDGSGLSYWRYKLHVAWEGFGIFKVSMDDEVLEAWRPR